ncbi:hypothetical protein EV175_000303 [Coemansia sp. RSA 1933]|nr:hypothetical protein EV175_000303 [Coemansia sp. RSA 1933]
MNRVAIVTGASRGLGLAISREFLKNGVSVIGVARSHETLAKVHAALSKEFNNSRFIPCTADLSITDELDKIVECLDASKLNLCALVNNAAVAEPFARLSDMDVNEWKWHFDIGVTSVVGLTQKLLPALRQNKGRVINVTSGASTTALCGLSAYCAGKAALNMITQSIGLEEPDVVSLALGPGTVDTDMQTVIRETGKEAMGTTLHSMFMEVYESGGLLPAEGPARDIVKLALDAPKEISGQYHELNSSEIAKYLLQ